MMRVIHAVEYLRGRDAEAILQMIIKDFPAEAVVREAKETLKRLQIARKN